MKKTAVFIVILLFSLASLGHASITAKRASRVAEQPNPMAGTLYRLSLTPSQTNTEKDTVMIYAPGGESRSVYYPFRTGNGDTAIVVSVKYRTTAYDSTNGCALLLDMTTKETISSTYAAKFAFSSSSSASSPDFITSSSKTSTSNIYVQKDLRAKAQNIGTAPGFRICYLETGNVSISPIEIDIWIPHANFPKSYQTK